MLAAKVVEIRSRDYWFKVVEFLQQNWALIDEDANGAACTAFFFGDTSRVFDRLRFPSMTDAELALLRNGFKRYDTDTQTQEFIRKPEPLLGINRHDRFGERSRVLRTSDPVSHGL